MSQIQLVRVRFPTGYQDYTYGWTGSPLQVGDEVEVDSFSGKQIVEVVEIDAPELPAHITLKHILRKVK